MDKYFKVSIFFFFFFSLKAILSSFKKRERCDFITKHLTDCYVICCIIGFNHVRQIQNKAELEIFKMMNT